METEDHPLETVHYSPKQEASTQDWPLKSFKYYFIEGLWEVVRGDKGGLMSGWGGKLRHRKKQRSLKPRSLEHPPLLTLPPPFKRLHKQSSECWVSERITWYSVSTVYKVPLSEKLLLSCYEPFYSTLISDKRRLKSVGGKVRKKFTQCLSVP